MSSSYTTKNGFFSRPNPWQASESRRVSWMQYIDIAEKLLTKIESDSFFHEGILAGKLAKKLTGLISTQTRNMTLKNLMNVICLAKKLISNKKKIETANATDVENQLNLILGILLSLALITLLLALGIIIFFKRKQIANNCDQAGNEEALKLRNQR